MHILNQRFVLIGSICPKLLILKDVITRMPKSSSFRTPFGNQLVKGSKTLVKPARKHFYANGPLISRKLSCVSMSLIGSKILRPLFNTLMADNIYSCQNSQKFVLQVQTKLSSKPANFLQVSLNFSNLHKILSILKTRSPSEVQYVRSFLFRKMSLLECPKTLVSEQPLEINVLRGGKHCWTLHDSTFMVMFQ